VRDREVTEDQGVEVPQGRGRGERGGCVGRERRGDSEVESAVEAVEGLKF